MISQILFWIEAHPGTAAWVQAVFTVLAIAVAIFAPWWQHRAGVKLAQQLLVEKAHAILTYVQPDYFPFRAQVETTVFALRNGKYNNPSPTQSRREVLQELKFAIPASFIEASKLAIEADQKTIEPFRSMYAFAITHNGYIDRFGEMRSADPNDWLKAVNQIDANARHVSRFASEAWHAFAQGTPDPLPGVTDELMR